MTTWLSTAAVIHSVDKHGTVLMSVWAESHTGKTQIQVNVTLTAEQIEATAQRCTEMRAKYPTTFATVKP